MGHPLFDALDTQINPYLNSTKNELIKTCKDKGISAEFSDNLEDLAFLIFRYEKVNEMETEVLSNALSKLGFEAEGKKKNVIQLITFELCLTELLGSETDEIKTLCDEYEVDHTGLVKEEVCIKLAVVMCK